MQFSLMGFRREFADQLFDFLGIFSHTISGLERTAGREPTLLTSATFPCDLPCYNLLREFPFISDTDLFALGYTAKAQERYVFDVFPAMSFFHMSP